MPISIPSPLVEFILLGPADDRRQLQDSPILGDVWVEFGRKPTKALDLLIAPYRGEHAGAVASAIDKALEAEDDEANIAYLQGLVVARLRFDQVLEVVVPKTKWWLKRWKKLEPTPNEPNEKPVTELKTDSAPSDEKPFEPFKVHEFAKYSRTDIEEILKRIVVSAKNWHLKKPREEARGMWAVDRFIGLSGLLLWGAKFRSKKRVPTENDKLIGFILREMKVPQVAKLVADALTRMLQRSNADDKPLIWQVSLNRTAMPALTMSIPAVKADAAKTLFKVDCSDIVWAVIDSGIDGNHPAFRDNEGKSRVKRSFDFKSFRRIVSLSNGKPVIRKKNVDELLKNRDLLIFPTNPTEDDLKKLAEEADQDLQRLARDARERGPIHWELVQKYVEIKPGTPPQTNHGTHVAGIIGASKSGAQSGASSEAHKQNESFADGMCPDIQLFDFRVLGIDMRDTEFAIIAALQYIRYLNDRDNFLTIHGANLSLSIPHDVRNFACGRTPICIECERMVESGVLVVAAAGNHGYQSFETKEGSYESYAAFSITDPGNADGVITVGATHRFWPHTYGVSFFSSRGPTGDGRLKPDLVAPGERIKAPLPGNHEIGGDWGDLDGTSMAAPHVSGAAAMLMARYSELIGQPRRIKKMLCDSATDLGRERSFQGHGMLDVLRAFQSI